MQGGLIAFAHKFLGSPSSCSDHLDGPGPLFFPLSLIPDRPEGPQAGQSGVQPAGTVQDALCLGSPVGVFQMLFLASLYCLHDGYILVGQGAKTQAQ